jgi:TolB-like protein/DNA-binding winged helix-turn-helix (wHTH) protein/Tfp pilus assembly protein PilF
MQRARGAVQDEFKVGDFRVAVKLNRISQNGTSTRVEPRVMQVLVRLAERPGEVVSKDALFEAVWADTHVTDDVLTGCISTLRKVFGDNARTPTFIQTIPKAGYRLIAPVQFTNGNGSPGPAAEISERPTNSRRAAWAVGFIMAAMLAAAGAWLWRRTHQPAIDSVAILPFANSSADPNAEYLSDGISESIIDSMSQLPRLRVMAWSTVSRFKGKTIDPISAGRDMGVRAVLTGQIVQQQDHLLIQTELVDLRSGTQLWGERYDRKSSDLIPLQEDIARQISDNLRLRLTGEDQKKLAKRYTTDPEAYRLYLRGRYFWNKRSEDGMKKAVAYFQQAIDRDPTYALAYAGLADSYDLLDDWGTTPPRESFPKARAAALKALELDDSLAEAHTSLAFVKANYDWDFTGGEKEFQRAIALDPNYATAHQWYAMQLASMTRFPEAEAEMQRAFDLDPLSIIITMGVGEVYIWEGKYAAAVEQFKKTLDLDPNFAGAHGNLSSAYDRLSMYQEGVEELEKAAILRGEPEFAAAVAKSFAKSGYEGELRTELEKSLADRAAGRYMPASSIADLYAVLGDREQSLRWLQTAYQEHDSGLVFLNVSHEYDFVRGGPPFQAIVAKVGLPVLAANKP